MSIVKKASCIYCIKINYWKRSTSVWLLLFLHLELFSSPEKASEADVPKNSKNSTQYQQYKNELMKGDIIENSKPIISGSDLKDPKVISELTKNGSSISDWAKMESTYSYETSMGKGKVHYYQNLKTGEISFYDVKMKVPIPKDLKIRNGLTDDFWIIDLDNNFIPKGVR